jgi:hypothetical protein
MRFGGGSRTARMATSYDDLCEVQAYAFEGQLFFLRRSRSFPFASLRNGMAKKQKQLQKQRQRQRQLQR